MSCLSSASTPAHVGLGLIGDPELLFLDEPTTGFDPAARQQFWEVIRGLRDLGKTVVLTTHYMDEAQALADRVAVVRAGVVVAEGTPSDLGGRDLRRSRVRFALPVGTTPGDLPAELDGVRETRPGVVELHPADPAKTLGAVLSWAQAHGADLADLEVTGPSLEEIYLELTREGSP